MKLSNEITAIIHAIQYTNQFRGNTFLIKLGGSLLYDEALIDLLCFDLKLLKNAGIHLIVVHGGSKAINAALAIRGIGSPFIEGKRVTSKEAMPVIESVLCGQVNQLLVRKLNHIGLNAVGLSGVDNNLIKATTYSKQHGFVGKVQQVNPAILNMLPVMPHAPIAVIAPIGVNEKGEAMNINADEVASSLATACKVDKLIYLTDQDGIYDEKHHRFSTLSPNQLFTLIKTDIIKGGMFTKVNAILDAMHNGLSQVHILNGKKSHVLIKEIFTASGIGTLCTKTEKSSNSKEIPA